MRATGRGHLQRDRPGECTYARLPGPSHRGPPAVFFEEQGYRTISLDLMREQELLIRA